MCQRAAEPVLGFQALVGGIGEGGAVKTEGVAPGVLGLVHRGIGVGDQVASFGRIFAEQGDADARAHLEVIPATDREGFGDQRQQLARTALEFAMIRDVVDDRDELVPSDAGDGSGLELRLQALPQDLQQIIPDAVPQAVVDGLEAVQIHEQDGQKTVPVAGLLYGLVQLLVQQRAVGQAGERIVSRLIGQLCLVRAQAGLGRTALFDFQR